MNQDQPELTLEESVKQVMQTLPPVIRDYLSQGKYTPVARSLMARYGLRIDQGGVLEREIMLLLMGIENPDEFSKALAEEAKLDQKTINGIVQDINEQIFVPLREEMRKGAETVSAAPKAAAATPPRPDWGSHAFAPLSPRPASATPMPHAPANIKPPQVLVPAPPQSQTQTPQRIPSGRPGLRNLLASITTEVPKSIESRKLLEDHEEPHIEFSKLPSAVPNIAVPVTPGAASMSSKPTAPKVPPPAKPYSVDPYREPLDEK